MRACEGLNHGHPEDTWGACAQMQLHPGSMACSQVVPLPPSAVKLLANEWGNAIMARYSIGNGTVIVDTLTKVGRGGGGFSVEVSLCHSQSCAQRRA